EGGPRRTEREEERGEKGAGERRAGPVRHQPDTPAARRDGRGSPAGSAAPAEPLRRAFHSCCPCTRAPDMTTDPSMLSPATLPENSCFTATPFTSVVKVKRRSSPESRTSCSLT